MFDNESINELMSQYKYMIRYYSKILNDSPEGYLGYQKNHGHDQFLHIYKNNGKRRRESLYKKNDMIKILAKKEFAKEALKVLKSRVDQLEGFTESFEAFDPGEILRGMKKAYELLPEDYFFDREQLIVDLDLDGAVQARVDRHREWGNQTFEQSDYMPEYKRHTTSRGLKVRSKSEALIVEMLYRIYDIPNHYEQVQSIDNILICPDFTFEGADGQLFYWEHLGMMDNEEYAKRNLMKLDRYCRVGIVPGDNLILSFDKHGSIDMKYIEGIIMNEVLPRL